MGGASQVARVGSGIVVAGAMTMLAGKASVRSWTLLSDALMTGLSQASSTLNSGKSTDSRPSFPGGHAQSREYVIPVVTTEAVTMAVGEANEFHKLKAGQRPASRAARVVGDGEWHAEILVSRQGVHDVRSTTS